MPNATCKTNGSELGHKLNPSIVDMITEPLNSSPKVSARMIALGAIVESKACSRSSLKMLWMPPQASLKTQKRWRSIMTPPMARVRPETTSTSLMPLSTACKAVKIDPAISPNRTNHDKRIWQICQNADLTLSAILRTSKLLIVKHLVLSSKYKASLSICQKIQDAFMN